MGSVSVTSVTASGRRAQFPSWTALLCSSPSGQEIFKGCWNGPCPICDPEGRLAQQEPQPDGSRAMG